MKRRVCWLLGPLLAVALGGRGLGQPPVSADPLKVTLVRVWASRQATPDISPEELKRHKKLLEDSTRKKSYNHFRGHDRPMRLEIPASGQKEVKLPEGYVLALRALREGERWYVRFDLENRDRKWRSKEVKISCAKHSVILTPAEQTRGGAREQLVVLLLYESAEGS